MNLKRSPILYLITRGATTETTTPASEEFQNILKQIAAAVSAGITLVQIREKKLLPNVLFELAASAVAIARESTTRILVNDRADIAAGAGAAGVHLTTSSISPDVIRKAFGPTFVVGASTHSLVEARTVRDAGADFAVFGPVFPTPAKEKFGNPVGIPALAEAARALAPFPLLALGGLAMENVEECLLAGASGIAAIRLFNEKQALANTVERINDRAQACLN